MSGTIMAAANRVDQNKVADNLTHVLYFNIEK